MIKFLQKVHRNLIYLFWIKPYALSNRFKKIDFSQNVYIFAMGRGGSTLLLEAIEKGLNRSTKIWEPLASGGKKIKPLRRWGFTNLPYIPEESNEPKLFNTFKQLFNGEILSLSLTYVNQGKLFSIPFNNHLIFKFCRGNLILPWLTNNFNFKPILLLRSPYSTINSQLNHNAYSELNKNPSFLIDSNVPFYRELNRFEKVFDSCNTIEEHLAIKWSLNLQIIHHKNHNKKWLTIFYEDLVRNPKKELIKIKNHIGLPIDIEKSIYSMKKTSSSGSSGKKNKLSHQQIKLIDGVLDQMNVLNFTKENFKETS